MRKIQRITRTLGYLTALVCATAAYAAPVVVSFSTPTPTFTLGQVVSVNVLANIPDPILGFGLDVKADPSKLRLTGFTAGPLWATVPGVEADDIAGLAFPTAVNGSGVLLGTLSFMALSTGATALNAGFDSTNLAEGFPLLNGGFAANNLLDEATPTPPSMPSPEPSFGLLFSAGCCLLGACKLVTHVRARHR